VLDHDGVSQDSQDALYQRIEFGDIVVEFYGSYKGWVLRVQSHWSKAPRYAVAADSWRHAPVTVTRIPPYRQRGVYRGPPGEGDAAPYTTPLRGPAPLLGREKSGVGGTGIMTGETGQ
jgi:hypothetical protein